MFQRNYISAALALCLIGSAGSLLGGCATDSATGLPVIDPTVLSQVETDIQNDVQTACSFVPDISSVASVVASYVGVGAVVDLVTQATKAICTAAEAGTVTNPPTATIVNGKRTLIRRTATPIIVNGQQVSGYYISK
jgi:hypothetical protein